MTAKIRRIPRKQCQKRPVDENLYKSVKTR